MSFGTPEAVSDSQSRLPVYLQVTHDLTHLALTFALGDGQSQLSFVAAGVTPSLVQSGQPGVAAVAFLGGVTATAGDRLLLGYIEGPAGALPGLQMYGLSATTLDDNRDVHLNSRSNGSNLPIGN